MNAQRERPIIFTGWSVNAILAGRKSETRRLVKPQPFDDGGIWRWKHGRHVVAVPGPRALDLPKWAIWKEARYRVGDRLWVRETWQSWFPTDADDNPVDDRWHIRYRADNVEVITDCGWDEGPSYRVPRDCGLDIEPFRWRSPIFMPRWASRLLLEVTEVRVEQLQAITEDGALAEGVFEGDWLGDPIGEYIKVWNDINKNVPWESNPFVWVVGFERVKP